MTTSCFNQTSKVSILKWDLIIINLLANINTDATQSSRSFIYFFFDSNPMPPETNEDESKTIQQKSRPFIDV